MLHYFWLYRKFVITLLFLAFNIIAFMFLAMVFMESEKTSLSKCFIIISFSFATMFCLDKILLRFFMIQSFFIMSILGTIVIEIIQFGLGNRAYLHSISAIFLSLSLYFFIVSFKLDFIIKLSNDIPFLLRRFMKCLILSLFFPIIYIAIIPFMGIDDCSLSSISILMLIAGYTVSSVYAVIPFLNLNNEYNNTQ